MSLLRPRIYWFYEDATEVFYPIGPWTQTMKMRLLQRLRPIKKITLVVCGQVGISSHFRIYICMQNSILSCIDAFTIPREKYLYCNNAAGNCGEGFPSSVGNIFFAYYDFVVAMNGVSSGDSERRAILRNEMKNQ